MFLEHVNMSVSNVDQTIDFYQRVLGLSVRWRGTSATGAPAAHIGDDHCYLALFEVQDRNAIPPDYDQLGLKNGNVVEVLRSEERTWTIIMTAPNGVSCVLAIGEHWQEVVSKADEIPL